PQVSSVTQLGIRLRVLIPKEIPDPDAMVKQRLEQQQVKAQVSLAVPSLEDVFVAVTELQDLEEQAA
ncbi:MAG: ABC transporter ATP-binding protein, partial [Gammaproteobacteria bacterium]|nr:ABC transporter ATP-binding protein [Gammaproteobacteria bacterium]